MISSRTERSDWEEHAIVTAARECDAATVVELLDMNPRLMNTRDDAGESLPILAARYGAAEVAEALMLRGAVLDIHEAVALGKLAQVQALVELDPELVDLRDRFGWTPLHAAAHAGELKIVETLLLNGADVTAETPEGQTPLHCAVAASHAAITRLLLSWSADIHAKSHDGSSPLHLAAQQESTEMVELLVEYGGCMHARRRDGATPFMAAVLANRRKVVRLLVRYGADRAG